jgi:hypothetical protein
MIHVILEFFNFFATRTFKDTSTRMAINAKSPASTQKGTNLGYSSIMGLPPKAAFAKSIPKIIHEHSSPKLKNVAYDTVKPDARTILIAFFIYTSTFLCN